MPEPLSLDIRFRFQRCIKNGPWGRSAAHRLVISPANGARSAKRARAGRPIMSTKCGHPHGCGKPGPYSAYLRELVVQDTDFTLRELHGALT